ncbi:MAG TPA: LysR family transcriptional regulator [Anaeromyxobacter sp.]|nr:LysR family transcriptional regulator [Anaeromyxobacter sp.]
MNLQRLEGFYWVARCGGYARAARAFPYPITAPGVHQQVKKLEAELGVRLFERTGRERLTRTPAGAQLFELLAPFMEKLPVLLGQIAGGELGGRIRVRAPALVLRTLLPPWLGRLERAHPRLQVDLDDIGEGDLGVLQRGEADVYIDHLELVPPDVATLRIGTLRAFVVLPARHRLARARSLQLRELEGEAFVAYSGDRRARDLQLRALAVHDVRPSRLVGASSSDTILALVAAGLGFSIVPSLPDGPDHLGVASWPLGEPATDFPVLAAWRRQSSDHPLVTAFIAEAPREPRRPARVLPGGALGGRSSKVGARGRTPP